MQQRLGLTDLKLNVEERKKKGRSKVKVLSLLFEPLTRLYPLQSMYFQPLHFKMEIMNALFLPAGPLKHLELDLNF